jgi:hypothetical protein
MQRWIAGTGSGFAAAIAVAILYFCIDSMHKVNGVGLLQRQGRSVPQYFLTSAVVQPVLGRYSMPSSQRGPA